MPAYGQSGPYREARALGVHLESVMGHTLLRGYSDLDPSYITSIFSGDYVAGAHGAFAVMAALRHRRRTGQGQLIEMAQAECAGGLLAQAFMDYALNGRVQERIGNGSLRGRCSARRLCSALRGRQLRRGRPLDLDQRAERRAVAGPARGDGRAAVGAGRSAGDPGGPAARRAI